MPVIFSCLVPNRPPRPPRFKLLLHHYPLLSTPSNSNLFSFNLFHSHSIRYLQFKCQLHPLHSLLPLLCPLLSLATLSMLIWNLLICMSSLNPPLVQWTSIWLSMQGLNLSLWIWLMLMLPSPLLLSSRSGSLLYV